jgi:REP element-mobilizing transposase RayT
MGYPRRLYVPPNTPGTYHCISRCVRRAFLCGRDPVTGRSFAHRRQWIENRILELATVFAVAVHAYAVMSNHFHLVVEVDPSTARKWPDEVVARRWLMLSRHPRSSESLMESRVAALAAQPERLETLRERLGNLSWFMRYLNEAIARRANREDDCTGRFWEGRFVCQALLDDSAVLGAMVYVDLNPVRAGLAATPEESLHTSVRKRARALKTHSRILKPVASSIRSQLPPMVTDQYLSLVDWTGRSLHTGETGSIPTNIIPILQRLSMRSRQWLVQVPATESHYWRAIGATEAMIERARGTGLKWLQGIGTARALARLREAT